jgi:hypothetical protein
VETELRTFRGAGQSFRKDGTFIKVSETVGPDGKGRPAAMIEEKEAAPEFLKSNLITDDGEGRILHKPGSRFPFIPATWACLESLVCHRVPSPVPNRPYALFYRIIEKNGNEKRKPSK